jgi:hypothetical protein
MAVSLHRNSADQPQAPTAKVSKPDIYDILARMLIGLAVNFITRKLRMHQEHAHDRKVAARKLEKLAKKGKEAPSDLKEQAVAGLSKRQQKKFAKELARKKAAKGKKKGKESKKKKKGGKLRWVFVLAIAIALVVKAAAGKK